MMKHRFHWATLGAMVPLGLIALAGEPGKGRPMSAASIYDFTVKDMDGKDVALAKYKGDVLLIVNVASK
jgi:glutathione peroxidase